MKALKNDRLIRALRRQKRGLHARMDYAPGRTIPA